MLKRASPRMPTLDGAELLVWVTGPLGSVALSGAAALVIGLALVAKPLLVGFVIAAAIAVVGVWLALTRPALCFGFLVAILGLIPTYASPTVGSLLFDPGAAACLVIGIVLMWQNFVLEGRALRVNYVDLAALAFLVLMFVSLQYSPRVKPGDLYHLLFLWIGPYLLARVLLARVERPARVAAIAFAVVAVVLAPIAFAEAQGASNPFFNLNFNGTEFNTWNSQISRFGQVRAATSFAHPIAFSMFLAASALLSFAQGVTVERPRERLLWYAIAALTVGEMSLTISRTGWVMVGVGVLLFGLIGLRGPYRRQIVVLLGLAIGAFVVLAVVDPHAVSKLPGFSSDSHEAAYQSSGRYREALLERALQPGVLHAWGNAQNEITAGVGLDTATDNTYIIIADEWGLIPAFALIAVALALFLTAIRRFPTEATDVTAILPIVGFATMVAIFFVAFISQQQSFVWLLAGAGGMAAERIAVARRGLRPTGAGPATGGSRSARRGFAGSGWRPDRPAGSPSG